MNKPLLRIGFLIAAVFLIAIALYKFLYVRQVETGILAFPETETLVNYSEVVELGDGGLFQTIFFEQDGELDGFGVRQYSNSQELSPETWVLEAWDPDGLLVLERLMEAPGEGVRISDYSEWGQKQEGLTDFTAVAVISAADKILVIDSLNSIETEDSVILGLLSTARLP